MLQLDREMKLALGKLAGSDARLKDDLISSMRIKRFSPRKTIVMHDETDNDVFLILKGRARADVVSVEGQDVWIDDLTPGDLFGEMAALGDMPRTAEIRAVTEVTVALYSAKVFIGLMQRHGNLGIIVSRRLIEHLRNTTRRMFELSALSAPGRIYAELLRLADFKEGELSQWGVIRPVPVISVLARRVNSTRETASRTINDLVRRGLIVKKSGYLLIAPLQEQESCFESAIGASHSGD
ncbi:transcriptional regulator Crp [Iodidimonas gelatinilytica]|uniref:Transcriptional regulator Crp n=1 Tax=Iodidimonas gelatinilytica TaxID=1236966 RepID=A0A5A7MWT4_9PROT|nr:Crp/Fnr family transcriptional regulator [Iodidimonas gelatinilytica]GEQ99369.1 transcriptional regulator Crp [Iodidimonas gelatinilytica]